MQLPTSAGNVALPAAARLLLISRAHSSKPNLSPHEPANYRPISNLCTFSKISEKLVLSRLQPHVMRSANYCKFQSAYRKSHSTETALLRVINDIQKAAGNGQCRDGRGSIFLHPTQPVNLWTQPNQTQDANTKTQSTHHTNADTSTVEPIFYMSFISQLCLLKNKGKRTSISVTPVYCSGRKKAKFKGEK